MIVGVARLLGKVFEFSHLPTLYRANADFLIISIWASSWKNGICSLARLDYLALLLLH
jgi:hypothetical protein